MSTTQNAHIGSASLLKIMLQLFLLLVDYVFTPTTLNAQTINRGLLKCNLHLYRVRGHQTHNPFPVHCKTYKHSSQVWPGSRKPFNPISTAHQIFQKVPKGHIDQVGTNVIKHEERVMVVARTREREREKGNECVCVRERERYGHRKR